MSKFFWEIVLGVERDASVAEIRRAYAALLKQNRPDDDPEAFQRLLRARDTALAYAKHGARGTRPPEPRAAELAIALRERVPDPPGPLAAESRLDEGEAGALAASENFRPPVDPSDLERRLLLTLADETRWEDTLPAWQGMVQEIGTLDFGARREIEGSVIDALSGLLKRVAERPPAGPGDPAMRELAAVVVALDDEFGWAEDDRTLHDVLDDPAATDTFKTFLAQHRFIHHLHAGGFPERQDAHGLPALDRVDLESFFQKESPIYIAHLAKMRAAGRWLPSFDIKALSCGLFWVLTKRLDRVLLGGIVLVSVGILLDWLHNRSGLPHLGVPVATFCILLAMHVYCGALGRNERLRRAQDAVLRADAKFISDPPYRAAWLRAAGRQRNWPLVLLLLVFLGVGKLQAERAIDSPFATLWRQLSAVLPLGSSRPAPTPAPARAPALAIRPPPAQPVDAARELAQLVARLFERQRSNRPSFLEDARIDLAVTEAALVAGGRREAYSAFLRGLLDQPFDPRIKQLLRTHLASAEKGEPAGGFKSCPDWTSSRPAPAYNMGREIELKMRLRVPSIGSEVQGTERSAEFSLALSELGTRLLATGRGAELVATLAEVREREPNPAHRRLLEERIACALSTIRRASSGR